MKVGDETGGKETAMNSNGAEALTCQSIPNASSTKAPTNSTANPHSKILDLLRGFNDFNESSSSAHSSNHGNQ